MNDLKMAPDSTADFDMFDRVVMAKESHSVCHYVYSGLICYFNYGIDFVLQVPLGHKGTIVGIHSMVDPNPVRQENQRRADMFYDILFDEQFDDGGSIENVATKRMFKVSQLHLINISYGIGKYNRFFYRYSQTSSYSYSPAKFADKDAAKKPAAQNSPSHHKSKAINTANNKEAAKKHAAQNSRPHSKAISETDTANNQLWAMLKQNDKATNSSAPAPAAKPNNQEQYKQINVEDLFKVAANNLPKPPDNWRNKMVSQIVPEAVNSADLPKPPGNWRQRDSPKSSEIVHPKVTNLCMPVFARPEPSPPLQLQSGQPIQPQIQSTFFPQNSPLSNRPQGPQNLSRNEKYPPGHGAFIPLQATRNQAKNSHKQQQNERREERKVRTNQLQTN